MSNVKVIDSFRDEYAFLSNFYACPVTYEGITYSNSEAAFQAQKCPEKASLFEHLSASEAKKLGRQITLRPDWNRVRYSIMYQVVKAKFTQHPELATRLLATGGATLIEGNTWGDKVWGQVNGVGTNWLGEILTLVRAELRTENLTNS